MPAVMPINGAVFTGVMSVEHRNKECRVRSRTVLYLDG